MIILETIQHNYVNIKCFEEDSGFFLYEYNIKFTNSNTTNNLLFDNA